MALKYPSLDCLAVMKASGVRSFLVLWVAFVNSFWRRVRRGVNQGLNLAEGPERGAEASSSVVRAESAEGNHWLRGLAEGASGAGGNSQFLSLSIRPGQSDSCQCGLGLSLMGGWGKQGN